MFVSQISDAAMLTIISTYCTKQGMRFFESVSLVYRGLFCIPPVGLAKVLQSHDAIIHPSNHHSHGSYGSQDHQTRRCSFAGQAPSLHLAFQT